MPQPWSSVAWVESSNIRLNIPASHRLGQCESLFNLSQQHLDASALHTAAYLRIFFKYYPNFLFSLRSVWGDNHSWNWIGPVLAEWKLATYNLLQHLFSAAADKIENVLWAVVIINPIRCGGGTPPLWHFCDSPKKINGESCQFLYFSQIWEWKVGDYFLQSDNL